MAKRIRIIPWLYRSEFDKQLNEIGKEKHKINVDVNGSGTDDMVQKLNRMNNTATKSTSIFGKLKNAISDTFSSGKLAMTGYLAVLRGIDTAADNAKESIEALNKAETDLMIATDMSRESVQGLMKDYNDYAKQLAVQTENIASAADDYLRAGKTLEESQALIKDSIVLSKLGQIDSGTAAEDLLATMNGYEMSVDEVGSALDAMVAIDMKAATSAGDLATGLKYSASSASSAGLSFNKLVAILGTVQDKTQQSAETVGTFANQILSRYRDITIGNYLTDDGEDISNYESVLKSIGIKLRDSQGEFRAFEDVLQEMANSWDSLTSVQQNALIKVAAGTRQQNRFIALMEGYNDVLELTEVAANSAGTAVDKFNNSYMTSLEAKQGALQASFESMVYNSDFEEVYGDILEATTALVDFVNQTNALKGVMTGLAVTGGIKAFLTIKTGIHDAYINLNQFQNALNMVKRTNISNDGFDRLLLLTNNLSDSQMRLILSTDALSLSQKEDILVARGLSREEAKLKLQTYGVTEAQTGLTASTTSAKTAMQGFISVLKANPLFVIATAISAVSMAVSTYKNHLEEVRQATADASTAYKESASSIDDYVSKYQELREALIVAKGNEEETATVKQQLIDLQTELNSKYGEEAKAINLVTGEYEQQIEAIKALNREEANTYLNANRKGISTATNQMTKQRDYVLSGMNISVDTPDGKALQEIVNSYADEGMKLVSDSTSGMMQIVIKADAETAYETINAFETDLRQKAEELGNEHLFDEVLDMSSNALNDAQKVVEDYGDIYKQALMAQLVTDDDLSATYNEALNAVSAYNEALVSGENVTEAKRNLDDVKAKIEGNAEAWGKYSAITDEVFAQAGTNVAEYGNKVEEAMNTVEDAVGKSKSQMIDTINGMSDDFDILDKIYADITDKGTFDFTNLDSSKFTEAFSGLEEEYASFIETVSASPNDIEACQTAFNELVTAFINSKGILENVTEENKNLTISMLENMGVANAEEIVMAQLAMQTEVVAHEKQFLTQVTDILTANTAGEIQALLDEMNISKATKQELAQLALAKIHVNEQTIDTSADIENVIALANAANASALAISKLKSAQAVMSSYESGGLKSGAISMMDVREAQKVIDSIENGTYDFDYQPLDASDYIVTSNSKYTPKYTGGSSTADAIEKANKEAKESFNETVDFFERRAKVLEDNLSLIEKGMENVVGAFAKNTLINAQLGIVDEQVNNYTDALAMYQEKANQALSKLDADLQNKIVNGEVSLIDFDNEEVVEAMKDYEGWADKVVECKEKLEELKATIRELELAKFNNIIEDFTNQFDLYGDSIDLIKSQIGLLEEANELVGKNYYTKQIEQSQKQLEVLERQKESMVGQMTDAINSGRIQKGTDEFLEMANAITQVESEIIDVKTNIEEFNNDLLELDWQIFERVQTEIGNINDELSNLVGLFDDFDMSDGKGNWTKEAITTLGLYAQQYETARYQVQQYADAITQLEEDYKNGKYSATEYMDRLASLKQEQWNAINTVEELEDSIVALNETRINEEIEGINQEIDAYRELIQAKLDALDAEKDLHDYRKSITEQTKTIADIEKQLSAMANDDSASATAQKKLLQEQLNEERKKLEEMEYEHSIENQKDALNQQLENFEAERNSEIELLQKSLEDREMLISQSFETVKQNADVVGQEIALIAQEHGIIISDAIITPWSEGSNAIASYGDTLSMQSSAFIAKIVGVENEVYALQAKADTASVAISNMFGQRADNLVNELVSSYNAEWNLNNATNTLQNSLINTLERGYNISSITDGLNSIADAASSAADSLRDMYSAMNGGGSYKSTSPYSSGNPYQDAVSHAQKTDKASQVNRGKYFVIDKVTGNIVESNILTKEEAERKYGGNGGRYTIKAYAKGGIVSKDDDGVLNPIAKAIGEDTMVAVKYGESILTPIQTETLQKVAKVMDNPEFVKSFNIPSLNLTPPKIPQIGQNNRPNVTLHYDKMYEIHGDIYDAHQFEQRVAKISNKQTTKLLDDINRDYRISGR